MKVLAISVWIFINLMFFGICGYIYVLWSQYWPDFETPSPTFTYTYDQQIFLYNRGYPSGSQNDNKLFRSMVKNRTKHSLRDVLPTVIANSFPRFPKIKESEFDLDTSKYTCLANDSTKDCDTKTLNFKETLLKELKRVFLDESNVLNFKEGNRYNVKYEGKRGNYVLKSREELLCELKLVSVRTLRKNDFLFKIPLRNYMPRYELFQNKKFNTCAIVASAGSLKNSQMGYFIDSHNLVLRFNHAPTKNYEEDVGTKTTFRILNSQVVAKNEYGLLTSDLFKNVTILAWDPSNYTQNLEEWLKHPEYDLFPNYMQFRRTNMIQKFYILHPHSLWNLWNFLQKNSPNQLRRNPPSSGFLGLAILLPHCGYVDIFEYMPSTRVTRKCHYFDAEDNPACTFGVWHPLAAEKLITYSMNIADDKTVFQNGFVRIPGFNNVNC